MGKKKRGAPDIEEILARPWCYYCEKDFDDIKVLVDHQKQRHFRCLECNRRLSTIGGLSVHLQQVHKMTLTVVENALPNRTNPSIEIFGMEGIPAEIMNAHRQRLTELYFKTQIEHRARTGNPPVGGNKQHPDQPPAKKVKLETPEEVKARLLAKMAAKKEAQKNGLTEGSATTPTAAQEGAPASASSPPGNNLPNYGASVNPYDAANATPQGTFNPYQEQSMMPMYQPMYYPSIPANRSPAPFNPYMPPPPQAPNSFSPPGFNPYLPPPSQPAQMPFYNPPNGSPFTQAPQQPPTWSPPAMNPPSTNLTHRRQSPPYSAAPPLNSLPTPPGLPPRPVGPPPNVSKDQMKDLHTPQHPTQQMPMQTPMSTQMPMNQSGYQAGPPSQHRPSMIGNMPRQEFDNEIDQLIADATGQTNKSQSKVPQFNGNPVTHRDDDRRLRNLPDFRRRTPEPVDEESDSEPAPSTPPHLKPENLTSISMQGRNSEPEASSGYEGLYDGASDDPRGDLRRTMRTSSPLTTSGLRMTPIVAPAPTTGTASDPAADTTAPSMAPDQTIDAIIPTTAPDQAVDATPSTSAQDQAVDEPASTTAPSTVLDPLVDKPTKKDKKKHKAEEIKMMYDDNDVSPEEKMAASPRYRYTREEHTELVTGETSAQAKLTGAVTGAVDDALDHVDGTGDVTGDHDVKQSDLASAATDVVDDISMAGGIYGVSDDAPNQPDNYVVVSKDDSAVFDDTSAQPGTTDAVADVVDESTHGPHDTTMHDATMHDATMHDATMHDLQGDAVHDPQDAGHSG